jgi:crotonobetainyl-CoA:carnitine CoA-transferase CaiB-like acyl-CoA transferase
MTTPPTGGALSGLRVLDLGGMMSAYCSKLLADFGADVILVEPPAGNFARRLPPYAGDAEDPERSLPHLAFHTNKRSVVLDLTTPEGHANLLKLARTADVLLETFQPGYLAGLGIGQEELRGLNPRLVVCSVTPYGQTGPYASYRGAAIHAEALGGLLMLQGDPNKPPCMSPAYLGYSLVGTHAALGVMHALFAREETGQGQHVDVSMQEAVANILFIVSQYGYNSTIAQRPGAGAGGGSGMFACSDGWVGVSPIQPNQWRTFAQWMDNPILQDATFEDIRVRTENADFINGLVGEFIGRFTVQEFVEEAQKRRIPTAPVSTPAGLAENPHLNARDYFQDVQSPVVGAYRLPGPVARLTATPWRITRPAPRLGEHTQEVLAEADRAFDAGAQPTALPLAPRPISAIVPGPRLPLEGVRITDLTRIWVGPYGTRQLADFGAEVVKIESSLFDATSRIAGLLPMHPELNRNKLSITVDLHTPEGQEVVKRLVQVSDAVTENYAAGALARWGLDYESLRRVKPDIVYLSMPGWGATGPFAHHVLFGLQAQTASGVTYLWGYPDSPPSLRCGVYYADYFVGGQSAFVLEAALYHRKRTGQGQHIEVSQVEAQANALGVPLLDYFLNGVDEEPQGNFRAFAAPFGVYPCLGEDRWAAISCSTEQDWQNFVRAITPPNGNPPAWTQDPRFATLKDRVRNHEALDERVNQWTATLTPKQVMTVLQRRGVPAAAVQTTEEVYFDAQLNARGYIARIAHPEPQWGTIGHASFAAHLSDTPGAIRMGAPALGQHNDTVLRELLGYSDAEIRGLKEGKVLV